MKAAQVLLLVLMAGCTGVDGEQYMGRPGSPAWFATASPNTIAAYFAQSCTAYGFKPGTPEMAQCIQQEAGNKRSTNTAKMNTWAQINAANANAAQANATANRMRTTNCNKFGSQVNCTTY